jgi:hypothetical protein
MFAVGELEVRRGFVTDFEPFKMNNADVDVAAFPDLALLKFHRRKISSLLLLNSREMIREPLIFSCRQLV